MKIGVIGDAHFKDRLSYSDYIEDGRVAEKKEILDFIVESFEDCEHVVLLGDNFNSKNNSSETNREFVSFLEKFNDKQIYIISGNHEKKGDGKTAIDFLSEVKKDNWHIFTIPNQRTILIENLKVNFLPSMLNSELEVESHEEAIKKILKEMTKGDILFTHYPISGTSIKGITVDMFGGVILPKEELEKKYKLIVAGDIHAPQQYGNVIIVGSLFTSEVGEIEKFIWKIDDKLNIEKLKVPAREIHKIVNPDLAELKQIPKNSIVKVIITDKKINIDEIQEELTRFDASLLIEDYPNKRKKMHIEEGAFDFNIESLLELYAKEKKVDYQQLLRGLELIND